MQTAFSHTDIITDNGCSIVLLSLLRVLEEQETLKEILNCLVIRVTLN